MSRYVSCTPDFYQAMVDAYEQGIKDKSDIIIVDGKEYSIEYAYYVLEFIEMSPVFKHHRNSFETKKTINRNRERSAVDFVNEITEQKTG